MLCCEGGLHHEWVIHEAEKSALEEYLDKSDPPSDGLAFFAFIAYVCTALTVGYFSYQGFISNFSELQALGLSILSGALLGFVGFIFLSVALIAFLFFICQQLMLVDRICVKCQKIDLSLTAAKFERKKKAELRQNLEKEIQAKKDAALETLKDLKKTVQDFELDPTDWLKKHQSVRGSSHHNPHHNLRNK